MANFINYMPAFNIAAPMSHIIPYTTCLLEPVAGIFAHTGGSVIVAPPTMGQLFPSPVGDRGLASGTTTSGEAEGQNPDNIPTSPNAMDDEYEAGITIDTGKWTARLVTNLTTAIVKGALKLTLPSTGGTVVEGYTQNIPASGNCGFVVKRIFEGTNNNYNAITTFIEKGTGGSRKTINFPMGWNGGARCGLDRHSTDSDTFSATITSLASLDEHRIRMPFWVWIDYVGTNINFYYSWNGRGWVLLATEAEATWLGGRADRIGIGMQSGNAGTTPSGFFEYFRRVS